VALMIVQLAVALRAAEPGSIRGHVSVEGKPVAGAMVTLTGDCIGMRTLRTDRRGAYVVQSLPAGCRYNVTSQLPAQLGDDSLRDSTAFVLGPGARERAEFDFPLSLVLLSTPGSVAAPAPGEFVCAVDRTGSVWIHGQRIH